MSELGDAKLEVLSAIYEGQRAESLQHRRSIVNGYGFAFAALVALGAGSVAPGALPLSVKVLLTLAIVSICVLLYLFVRRQRDEAEKGLDVLRKIETYWGCSSVMKRRASRYCPVNGANRRLCGRA